VVARVARDASASILVAARAVVAEAAEGRVQRLGGAWGPRPLAARN
jgi:hypothetical protein